MAKRAKVLGLPIGRKKGPNVRAWVRGAAAVGGGAYAVSRVIKGRNQADGSVVQKGREALGKVSDASQKLSSAGEGASKAKSGLGKVAGAAKGSGGEDQRGHAMKTAFLIDEQIDVGVARHEVYDQWTQFKEFTEIAKAVENVDHPEGKDDETTWAAKIGPSRREWRARITEQIPDKRIAWKAEGQVNHQGVVTFHSLDDDLTRVQVQIVYEPSGLVEKIGNLFRIARFRVRRDLKLFKNYVELRGEASGAWRGEIGGDEAGGEGGVKTSAKSGGGREEPGSRERKGSSGGEDEKRSGRSAGRRQGTAA